MLRGLSDDVDGPWIYCGDFNKILNINEKSRDRVRRVAQINEFRSAIEDAKLMDIDFLGYEFTWSNKRKGSKNGVSTRLSPRFLHCV